MHVLTAARASLAHAQTSSADGLRLRLYHHRRQGCGPIECEVRNCMCVLCVHACTRSQPASLGRTLAHASSRRAGRPSAPRRIDALGPHAAHCIALLVHAAPLNGSATATGAGTTTEATPFSCGDSRMHVAPCPLMRYSQIKKGSQPLAPRPPIFPNVVACIRTLHWHPRGQARG